MDDGNFSMELCEPNFGKDPVRAPSKLHPKILWIMFTQTILIKIKSVCKTLRALKTPVANFVPCIIMELWEVLIRLEFGWEKYMFFNLDHIIYLINFIFALYAVYFLLDNSSFIFFGWGRPFGMDRSKELYYRI